MNYLTKQNGSSLIEILVAVFVVSIGLLGVARMEIFSTQSNFAAIQRTTAANFAHDFMEKMRANPAELGSYVGLTVGDGTFAIPGTDCRINNCTTADIAQWDIWAWEQQLIGAAEAAAGANTGGLDSPRGCITGPAGGAGEYTISIVWRGSQPQPNPATTNCGEGEGLYGANEQYRRVLTMTFFVSDDGVI
ncbi:MAG: type IV pilus modification protein PilV [Thioalkalispiraceae bacterium]|jgi:type IV pilus assembly protein PilV